MYQPGGKVRLRPKTKPEPLLCRRRRRHVTGRAHTARRFNASREVLTGRISGGVPEIKESETDMILYSFFQMNF
ncbi:hypothetical protein [Paraburkholderia gardini]|uniref:hypothetical protein n=1 Tax=Paraburkholderia gardini TaxID=2823469 RepID=UPI001E512CF8|nr:hypothetical protein [Paraburkholderia gardini]